MSSKKSKSRKKSSKRRKGKKKNENLEGDSTLILDGSREFSIIETKSIDYDSNMSESASHQAKLLNDSIDEVFISQISNAKDHIHQLRHNISQSYSQGGGVGSVKNKIQELQEIIKKKDAIITKKNLELLRSVGQLRLAKNKLFSKSVKVKLRDKQLTDHEESSKERENRILAERERMQGKLGEALERKDKECAELIEEKETVYETAIEKLKDLLKSRKAELVKRDLLLEAKEKQKNKMKTQLIERLKSAIGNLRAKENEMLEMGEAHQARKERLENVEAEVLSIRSEKTSLLERMDELEKENEKLKSQNEQQLLMLTQQSEIISKNEKETRIKNDIIMKLRQTKNVGLVELKQQLRHMEKDYQDKLGELQLTSEKNEVEIQEHLVTIEKMQKVQSAKEAIIVDLKTQLSNEKYESEVNESKKAAWGELELQSKMKDMRIEELQGIIQKQKILIGEKNSLLEGLKADVQDSSLEKTAELKSRLEITLKMLKEKEEEMGRAVEEAREFGEKKCQTLNKRIEMLEVQKEKRELLVEQLKTLVDQMKEDAMAGLRGELEKTEREHEQHVRSLKEEIQHRKESEEAAQRELELVIETNKLKLRDSEITLETLRNEIHEKDTVLDRLREKIGKHEDSRERFREVTKNLDAERDESIIELRKQLEKVRDNAQKVHIDLIREKKSLSNAKKVENMNQIERKLKEKDEIILTMEEKLKGFQEGKQSSSVHTSAPDLLQTIKEQQKEILGKEIIIEQMTKALRKLKSRTPVSVLRKKKEMIV